MLAIMHKNPEHLWVLIYRPTHCSVEDTLELCNVMERLSSKYKSISFLEDINIGLPWIDWSQDPPVPRSRLGDSWLDTCEFCNVKQIVNCPTRDDNFLDLVFTSRPDFILFYKCIALILSSFHAQCESYSGFNYVGFLQSFR